jgi:hypothetical protein
LVFYKISYKYFADYIHYMCLDYKHYQVIENTMIHKKLRGQLLTEISTLLNVLY